MTRFIFATILGAAVLSLDLYAQQGDTPVLSTVADVAAETAVPFQIRSDGLGSYVHRPRYLTSVVQEIGDWKLDLGLIVTKGSGRRVYLNFEQPVPGSGPSGGDALAPPSQQYIVRFITKCYLIGNNMFLLPAGQQMTCPMFIRFDDYNGNQYRIQMSRAAAPNSDEVSITCLAAGSDGRCARWSLTPSGLYFGADGTTVKANVGTLVKLLTKKGSEVQVKQGDFYFSFSIDVAR